MAQRGNAGPNIDARASCAKKRCTTQSATNRYGRIPSPDLAAQHGPANERTHRTHKRARGRAK
eukprot:5967817-Lingulodinium_polyedra.AAC.1